MIRPAASRAIASLVAGALVFAGLTAAAPAFADDDPAAVVESTDAPTAEPTPGDTDAVSDEPTTEPSEEPAADAVATPSTVTYTGRLVRTGDDELTAFARGDEHLFTVAGRGQVRVDLSALDLGTAALAQVTLRLAVPAGIALPDDPQEAFAALSTASITAPLVAVERVVSVRGSLGSSELGTSALINQTPAASATHKIYAVLVSPSGTARGSTQKAANVATSVSAADAYWNAQSSGKIRLSLAGTTAWYSSAKSCGTAAGSDALWTEASAKAWTQLGYVPGPNTHLVLFFPSTAKCGGAIGLGSIGYGINEGGVAWVIGTDAAVERHTLAHELGHNFSFGHASWLACSSSDPHPGYLGTTGCTVRPYGDATDVMGYGQGGKTGGALSSPNAIRSGLWDTDDYDVAPVGTNTFVINTVSGHTGKRAVMVEDVDGVNYFVEFRDQSGEDSQYSGMGCNSSLCVNNGPEVRVMRLEQQVFDMGGYEMLLKGFSGDDSYIIGRAGNAIGYKASGVFKSKTTGGVTVSVTSIGSTTATVSITRPSATVNTSYVNVYATTMASPDALRVGDVLTAFLEADWRASSYAFQWYRVDGGSETAIPSATAQSYTFTSADVGKGVYVKVTPDGDSSKASCAPSDYPDCEEVSAFGPIQQGLIPGGAVSVDAGVSNLTAATSGWPGGTTFTYQWLRNDAPISGATKVSYTPTSADRGKLVSVRATGKKSGYLATPVTSSSADYTLYAAGSLTVSGARQIGQELTVSSLSYTKNIPSAGLPVSPTITYQWFRSGVAISGATGPTYRLASADYGKSITVAATATSAGLIAHTATSASVGTLAAGSFPGDLSIPVITTSGSTKLTLTAALPPTSITEPGVTLKYAWYRGATAITTATAKSYTLTSADAGKSLSVKVTVSKTGYSSVSLVSAARTYTIAAAGVPVAGGVLKVGRTLEVLVPTYTIDGAPASPALAYQWYRSGVAIAGATGATYTLTAGDRTATLSVKVTASVAGYQSIAKTSAATGVVGYGVIQGDGSWPEVAQSGLVLTSSLPVGSITEAGVTTKVQWYRGAVAIAGKTAASYTLTSADYGASISVRYTISKSGYTSRVLKSQAENFSLVPSSSPKIVGDPVVGEALAVALPAYLLQGDEVLPDLVEYQWYRSGVAIPGAVGGAFTVRAEDVGATLTVKVTARLAGALPSVKTTAATPKIVARFLAGHTAPVTVTKAPGSLVLTASSGVTESGATIAYQWYRGATPVVGATKAAYTLSSADGASEIKVRVTASKTGYLTKVRDSAARGYRLVAGNLLDIGPTPFTGTLITPTFDSADFDGDSNPATRTVRYQWFRGTTALTASLPEPGAYTVTSADVGKALTLKITESLAGWLPITTTATTDVVTLADLEGDLGGVDVAMDDALRLTATLPDGTVSTPGAIVKWQWYRGSTAVAGKTAASYQLTSADGGSPIWVKATISKAGFRSEVLESMAEAHGIVAAPAVPQIVGQVKVGATLSVGERNYLIGTDPTDPTVLYQWLRNGVAIPDAEHPTYVLSGADKGKAISVRVTAEAMRAIPNIATSAATQLVNTNAIAESGDVEVSRNPTTLVLTVTDTGVADASAAVAYQWFRGTAAVTGKTAASYPLTSADAGKAISVRVTATKSGSTPLVKSSTARNYTLAGSTPVITGTRSVGAGLQATVDGFSTEDEDPVTPTAGEKGYQWYRSGVAIVGAVFPSYIVDGLDLGKTLTVKVTVTRAGYLPYVKTSAATTPIAKSAFTGTLAPPQLIANGPDKLHAELTAGSIDQPSVAKSVQWLRNGVAIAGATKVDYTLTSADRGKSIQVRFTLTKSGYSTLALTTTPRNFGIVAGQPLSVSGAVAVGSELTVDPRTFTADALGGIVPAVEYQWLRNGVAISGATGASRLLTSADFGATVSVRVTLRFSGLITAVETWSSGEPVRLAIP